MGLLSLIWPSSSSAAGGGGWWGSSRSSSATTTKRPHKADDDTTDSSSSNHNNNPGPGGVAVLSFDDLCQQLETNHPKLKSVTLGDLNNVKAVTLGQCLTGNTVVTHLTIDFMFLHRFTGSIFCFLDFIEFSPSLTHVELHHADLHDTKVCSTLLVLLPAISKNGNVRHFCMRAANGLVFYDVFGAFWHTIVVALFGGHPSATLLQTAVTVSMCQCQSLSHLQLERLPEGFLCQLLPDLHKVAALTKVTLVPKYYSVATFLALADLVRQSNSLTTVGLSGYRLTEKRFGPVVEALLLAASSARNCQALELTDCRLNRGATQGLHTLFTGQGSKMDTLVLRGAVTFDNKDAATVLVSLLTAPSSTIKVLDLAKFPMRQPQLLKLLSALSSSSDDDDEDDEGEEVNDEVSEAAPNLPLERLSLNSIATETDIDAVKRVSASLTKLRFIHIESLSAPSSDHIDDLLAALKCNVNMEQCSWNGTVHQLQQRPSATATTTRRPIDRTAALKRKESLRSLLSDDLIDAINAKDEYLQMHQEGSTSNTQQGPPSHVVEGNEGGTSEGNSNWEDLDTTTNGASETEAGAGGNKDSTKGSVESAANRHALASNVLNLLKDNSCSAAGDDTNNKNE